MRLFATLIEMNFDLILKTSLVAFCVAILGWAFMGAVYIHPSEIYLFLGFLLNTIWAGAYVYRNSTEHKAAQAVITILAVPLLSILLIIVAALMYQHPNPSSEFTISD